jgi:hypothetical protein
VTAPGPEAGHSHGATVGLPDEALADSYWRRAVTQAGMSTFFEAGSAAASSRRELMPSFWNTLRR